MANVGILNNFRGAGSVTTYTQALLETSEYSTHNYQFILPKKLNTIEDYNFEDYLEVDKYFNPNLFDVIWIVGNYNTPIQINKILQLHIRVPVIMTVHSLGNVNSRTIINNPMSNCKITTFVDYKGNPEILRKCFHLLDNTLVLSQNYIYPWLHIKIPKSITRKNKMVHIGNLHSITSVKESYEIAQSLGVSLDVYGSLSFPIYKIHELEKEYDNISYRGAYANSEVFDILANYKYMSSEYSRNYIDNTGAPNFTFIEAALSKCKIIVNDKVADIYKEKCGLDFHANSDSIESNYEIVQKYNPKYNGLWMDEIINKTLAAA